MNHLQRLPLLLSFLLMLFSSVAFSQSVEEDVVYLKNGSILRGRITEQKIGESLKIELMGGSILVFQQSEIDSVEKEAAAKSAPKKIPFIRKDKGYRGMVETGVIYGPGGQENTSDDFGIQLHTAHGYQFWPYLFVGAGLGIDRYVNYKQTFSPFYVRVASEFLKKRVTPYIYADAGYALMWKQKNTEWIKYQDQGGAYVSAGGGVHIYTGSPVSVTIGLSYKRTDSETKWWYTWAEEVGTFYTIRRTYHRMALNIGLNFKYASQP